MTHEKITICPHCGAHHDRASGVAPKGALTEPVPRDGDASLCITCGSWCIFDSSASGGMRAPKRKEQRRLDVNEMAQEVTKAWRQAMNAMRAVN